MSSGQPMNTLLTFDATRFNRHIAKGDDRNMVDFIVTNYGPALESAIRYYNDNLRTQMQMYYQDAYLGTIIRSDTHDERTFKRNVIDDEGEVVSSKARYDELVELVIDTFNGEVGAVLRSIQFQARKIYTVQVLGYENRLLRILLKTDAPIIP